MKVSNASKIWLDYHCSCTHPHWLGQFAIGRRDRGDTNGSDQVIKRRFRHSMCQDLLSGLTSHQSPQSDRCSPVA
jgi:hypothetical protein